MSDPARRVLITTVPFGAPDRQALDLLDSAGVDYTINPIGRRLKEAELLTLARDFGVIIAGTEPITAAVIGAAPHLRLISRVGIGLDSVDLSATRARRVSVAYTPDAPAPAVAELTIGLMLSLLRHVPFADRALRQGRWLRLMGRRLEEITVGIVGVGRVGRRVVAALRGGFPGVHILANDLAPDTTFGAAHRIEWVEKAELFRSSDVVSVHVPLTPTTQGMIGADELALMRPTALLINTARGGVVAEAALADALRSGRLLGAAMDVFSQEPYEGELAGVEQCLLTCHMGSMSIDCRTRMEVEATEEAIRFLRGEPLQRPVPQHEYEIHAARTAALAAGDRAF
ncbi:MAG: phosphoglycerate dehydrogenase [Vicinamibacterales bacterium]